MAEIVNKKKQESRSVSGKGRSLERAVDLLHGDPEDSGGEDDDLLVLVR